MAGTSFTLVLNTKATEKAFARLKDRAPAAISRALNRAADSATTAMVRAISQDTGIKQADLRGTTKRNRAIWSSKAAPGHEVATVYAALTRIPLIDFNAKGPQPSRGKGRGVTAGLRGGARRYPNAFTAKMGSGHVGVWSRRSAFGERKGKGAWSRNLPIIELRGPSIYHVWKKHAAIGVARANEQLVKNLRSEFRFAMGQTSAPPPSA